MQNNVLSKSAFALSALAIVFFAAPELVTADKPSTSKYGKTMTWKTKQGGHSYSRGSSQHRGHSQSSQRGHAHSNRGHSGHNHSSHNNSHRGHGHQPRSSSHFSITPYGFSYGRHGSQGSIHLNVPIRGAYQPNYYSPYGSYGYQYGNPRSTYYRSRSFSSYRPYSIPAYGTPRYIDPRGAYDRAPVYSPPRLAQPPVQQNPYTMLEPTTRSTLKPELPNDRLQFASNQLNVIQTNDLAEPTQRRAEQAFRMGSYADAARLANEALLIDRDNGLLMLFSAQANFAAGYYDQAVNEIDSATSRLPGEQWSYVVSNFRQFYGRDDYVRQVELLSTHIANNPTDERALTLRGYHYGGLGHPQSADNDFQKTLELNPNSAVAQRLRSVLGTAMPIQIQPSVTQPTPQLQIPAGTEAIPGTSVLEGSIEVVPSIDGPVIDGPQMDGRLVPDGNFSSYQLDGIEISGPSGQ